MFQVALTLLATAVIVSAVVILFVLRRDKKRELEALAKSKGTKKRKKNG